MVKAKIENEQISVLLNENESVTIPNNETWNVGIGGNNDDFPFLRLDGKRVLRLRQRSAHDTSEHVFSGGRTLQAERNNIFLNGYVIDE
jgi:hypothetical protein